MHPRISTRLSRPCVLAALFLALAPHRGAGQVPDGFTLGDPATDVLIRMGPPQRVDPFWGEDVWHYGESWVTLRNGIVSEWMNAGSLRSSMGVAKPRARMFKVGDPAQQVAAFLGTPTTVLSDRGYQLWRFATIEVAIDDEKVQTWGPAGTLPPPGSVAAESFESGASSASTDYFTAGTGGLQYYQAGVGMVINGKPADASGPGGGSMDTMGSGGFGSAPAIGGGFGAGPMGAPGGGGMMPPGGMGPGGMGPGGMGAGAAGPGGMGPGGMGGGGTSPGGGGASGGGDSSGGDGGGSGGSGGGSP